MIATNFNWELHESYNLAIKSFGLIIYFLWYFAVGLVLTGHVPELARTIFIINAFVVILSLIVVVIIFDGNYSGDSILGFIWVAYFIYALFQFMLYPAKVFKTIEQGIEATFSQYFGYLIMSIFWPIGIWWIQPKLNRISEL